MEVQNNLLLVDDEEDIRIMLKMIIDKESNLNLETAANGKEALNKIKKQNFELIILDIMLPDIQGYELCTTIRETSDTPILFLSAKSTDMDKLLGFAHGADDYITKPFNPFEVVARIKAIIRRSSSFQVGISKDEYIVHKDFSINLSSAELSVNGKVVSCTGILYQLLLLFSRNPNRVFSKDEIYERVWGDSKFNDDNTVMVHIRKLREKIEKDPSRPQIIKTIHGLGYKLVTRTES